jgi:CheY-like chemotaxis protein
MPPQRTACAELVVSDTGCGMDDDTRSHLFEMFFTTKQQGRGNGLGLATVEEIIKQQGGTVEVTSELGRGTTFLVRVPRSVSLQQPPNVMEGASPNPRGNATILLAEDNAAIRNAVRRVLRKHGYRVVAARNGKEAHQLFVAKNGEVDLILADITMPGMSGRELVRRLSQRQPALRVLFISGYEHRDNTCATENIVVFRKPFTGEALLKKVEYVLRLPTSQMPPHKEGNQA